MASIQLLSSLYSNVTSYADTLLAGTVPLGGLYKGVDTAALNVFETAWMGWYNYFDNPVIATGIMAFLMHEVCSFRPSWPFKKKTRVFFPLRSRHQSIGSAVGSAIVRQSEANSTNIVWPLQIVYFGRCIPWMIIDRTPYFRQWKLQEVRLQRSVCLVLPASY